MAKTLRYGGTIVVPTKRYYALEQIQLDALTEFGGYTSVPGSGGWANSEGMVQREDIVQVTVWGGSASKVRAWLYNSAYVLKREGEAEVMYFTQESVGNEAGIV